jgi:ABC-type transport system substrate-binding protein
LAFLVFSLVLLLTACSGGAATPAPEKPTEAAQPAQSDQVEATAAVPTEAPATAAPAEAPQEAGASGGTVRIGWAGNPDTLNPGAAVLEEPYTIFELVYNSMYNLELDGSYSLDLAESVDVSADGKAWTFKIRPDVKFHDGQPLTAKDVAFTYNFYQCFGDSVGFNCRLEIAHQC